MTTLYIATERFDPSDGPSWDSYMIGAKIPQLTEVVSLDGLLCPPVFTLENLLSTDLEHITYGPFGAIYFNDLNYLLNRTSNVKRKNVLLFYRNPINNEVVAPLNSQFVFMGFDLIDEETQISALTNCGGFPQTFDNQELNHYGLIPLFTRAREVKELLQRNNPDNHHAKCEIYMLWRLIEK